MAFRAPSRSLSGPVSALVFAVCALVPHVAHAGTVRSTLDTSIQVDNSCRMTLNPLSFGTATILSGQMDAQTTIDLRCGPAVPYSVAIDNGQNYNGQRRMYGGVAFGGPWYVNYEIYRNAARTQVWGSTAGNTVTGTTPTNGRATLTAYGRVPNSIVLPRAYIDTVTVTVTF